MSKKALISGIWDSTRSKLLITLAIVSFFINFFVNGFTERKPIRSIFSTENPVFLSLRKSVDFVVKYCSSSFSGLRKPKIFRSEYFRGKKLALQKFVMVNTKSERDFIARATFVSAASRFST